MRKLPFRKVIPPILFSALLATSCAERTRVVYRDPPPSGEVVVSDAPPAPIEETVTVSPGPEFVWVGGSWLWVGGRWRWEGGHWGRPPHPGAVWVPHRYVYRGGHHVWVRGGWR